ncbi:MAG: cytochrome c3 family protein [Terriglobia bacterium]
MGSLLGLLALGWVSLAQLRTQHPTIRVVEGGADVDFSACVECHADKSAAPVLHPALELGCDSCHQVEQEEGETEVLLISPDNQLCFTCHTDQEPGPTQLTLHWPVRAGRCTTCHDPHSTQADYLLRQATESREPAENLCLGCHAEIAAQIQQPVEHPAVELGCTTCHTTHKSEPAGAPEGAFHLTQAEPELCLTCHEAEDAALQEAHLNQPFAGSRCSECHNPHGSAHPKLLNNFVHPPFGDKECDTCHETPQEGQVALVEGAREELCLVCHSDMQERLEQAKFTHTAVVAGPGCVTCHSPHAATYPHQVRRGPVALCLDCHADLAKARVEKSNLHRPAFKQSCLICHQEHTGERPQRLRAEVNNLCLECHGSQNAAKFRTAGKVKLFRDKVEVEGAALAGMRILSIRAGARRGHPFPSHPVSDGESLNCVTCHDPHAANGSPRLLVTETATATPLCLLCHDK